jgi:hypothetical protein
MRKDDCGETDNLTGRNMPLRLIFDTTPSFLGHFRVGNGKSMTGITMDELCFSVRDHSLEEIDRTCRYKSLIFLAMTPTSTSYLAMILTSLKNIFAKRLVEHDQGFLVMFFSTPKSLMGPR